MLPLALHGVDRDHEAAAAAPQQKPKRDEILRRTRQVAAFVRPTMAREARAAIIEQPLSGARAAVSLVNCATTVRRWATPGLLAIYS